MFRFPRSPSSAEQGGTAPPQPFGLLYRELSLARRPGLTARTGTGRTEKAGTLEPADCLSADRSPAVTFAIHAPYQYTAETAGSKVHRERTGCWMLRWNRWNRFLDSFDSLDGNPRISCKTPCQAHEALAICPCFMGGTPMPRGVCKSLCDHSESSHFQMGMMEIRRPLM